MYILYSVMYEHVPLGIYTSMESARVAATAYAKKWKVALGDWRVFRGQQDQRNGCWARGPNRDRDFDLEIRKVTPDRPATPEFADMPEEKKKK